MYMRNTRNGNANIGWNQFLFARTTVFRHTS
jgi:hypothetical protein